MKRESEIELLQPLANRSMLTIYDDQSRRGFLQIGGLSLAGASLGGLSLSSLLGARAAAADRGNGEMRNDVVRDKSVIFLFLHGGPSQTETFDPKMDAPAEIRSATGQTVTRIPGVSFGGTFSKTAALADRVTVVRSYRTGDGRHDIKPVVGRDTLGANMGSLYARIAGTNHPVTGIPTNAMLFPRAVDESTQPGNNRFGQFTSSGELGAAYAPFDPGGGGSLREDMRLQLSRARLDDRRNLLSQLDRIKRSLDVQGTLQGTDRFQQQAFSTILGKVADSFNLSKEDPRTLARYDTAPLMRPENISRKWNNYNNYVDNGKTLGKLLLLARRLCEAGCGFVTVTTNFVWDMHSDVNNAGVQEGMQYMGLPLDHVLSAFLEDVEARGLSEKILLVTSGEMGRTPKINGRGGRDHWGGISPLLLAGGGLNMGQVIGQSTRDGGAPRSQPIEMKNLLATIMHTLTDVSEVRLMPNLPTEMVRAVTSASPIPGLM